jgi:tetratricopeptide (TPR) repeat protein
LNERGKAMRVNLFKTSRRKKLLLFIGLGLVVFLGAAFVYWQETKYQEPNQKTSNQEVPQEVTGPPEKSSNQEEVSKQEEPSRKESKSVTSAKTLQEKIKEADALKEKGEYDKAILLYHEIMKEDPHNVSIYNSLAALYAKKGDKEKALETIDKGLENNPGNFSLEQTKDLIEYVWFNK